MSEDETEGKVDWVIGRNVNLSGFTLKEIQEARKAGVEFEVNADKPDQSKVIKKVVEGMPAPKSSEKGKV